MQSETPGTRQPYIFVSYASSDRERVLRVAGALREAGLRLWIDLSDISGGAQYGSEIGDAIRGCQAVALMCSPAAFASRNVKQEIMLAWKYHRPYLPLLLEPTIFPLDVEYWLEGSQWIEVFDQPVEEWVPRVLQALTRIDDTPEPNGATPSPAGAAEPRIASALPPSSGMVGRSGLVRQLDELLRDGASRLVTLTGPGGTGKTRLSIEAATVLRPHFDAAVFVSLASIRDPALVVPTIATALGLREEQGKSFHDQIVALIGRQRLLLVLDNFEQVIDAAAGVDAIVRSCPSVTVLTTSRTRLGIYGEQELVVPPLARPDLVRPVALAELAQVESVALFVERARALKPDFALTAQNAPAVAEIVARLDGLPLAIELAAARVKLLSPQAMLARLDKRLPMLTGGARNLPERQQTLRNTIAWSYDLLSADERTLFRALSVFSGGWTFEAADALHADCDYPDIDIFDGLSSLVDKSLITQRDDEHGEVRFGMLETIREFGQDRLSEAGEVEAVGAAHCRWYRALVERAAPKLLGDEQEVWFQRIESERANLRVALAWCLEHDTTAGVALAGKLGRFWYQRGYLVEGQQWLELFVDPAIEADPVDRALALYSLAALAAYQGDYTRSRPLAESCLQIYRGLGDQLGMAMSLNVLGVTAMHEEQIDEANALWEEGLRLSREIQDQRNIAVMLGNLSWSASLVSDHERALAYIEESLTLARRMRDRASIAVAVQNLGLVALELGDLERASACFLEGLELGREIGSQLDMVECLEGCAAVASARGDWTRALRFYGSAAGARSAMGFPMLEWDRIHQRHVADAREHFGGDADVVWKLGLSLPLVQAVEEALAVAMDEVDAPNA